MQQGVFDRGAVGILRIDGYLVFPCPVSANHILKKPFIRSESPKWYMLEVDQADCFMTPDDWACTLHPLYLSVSAADCSVIILVTGDIVTCCL